MPVLPVGGVLLVGALLLWRGAVRARASRGVVADGPAPRGHGREPQVGTGAASFDDITVEDIARIKV